MKRQENNEKVTTNKMKKKKENKEKVKMKKEHLTT